MASYRPFTYDTPDARRFRVFKLDLNGDDDPLSGRLLTLTFPGTFQDQYKTFIKVHLLEQGLSVMRMLSNSDDYVALSYCWGDEPERFPLGVTSIAGSLAKNGQPVEQPEKSGNLWITASLKGFLLEMRRQRWDKFLWIDAICIDQDSIADKDIQIPRMRDIYEEAESVLVWLGEASSSDELDVLSKTEYATRIVAVTHTADAGTKDPNTFIVNSAGVSAIPGDFWPAISQILRHPWWRRLWTLQEIVIARSVSRTEGHMAGSYRAPKANLLRGSTHVEWQAIERITWDSEQLDLLAWSKTRQMGDIGEAEAGLAGMLEIMMCRESQATNGWAVSLGPLLLATRRREATLAQDMVLGMLAMLDRKTIRNLGLLPSMPVVEVFTRFAQYYISEEPRECLLNHTATKTRLPGLPSWCLDFSSRADSIAIGSRPPNADENSESLRQYPHAGFQRRGKWKIPQRRFEFGRLVVNVFTARDANHGLYNTSNARSLRPIDGKGCIRASGMPVDIVSEVIDSTAAARYADLMKSGENERSSLRKWDSQCLTLARNILPDGFGDVFARTITANKVSPDTSSASSLLFDKDAEIDFASRYLRWQKHMLSGASSNTNDPETFMDDDVIDFAVCLQSMSDGRCFFATKGGRIGLGPSHMEAGDELAVFFYCPTPYLLRQGHGETTFIGEAYVHGLMYGEALDMLERGEVKEKTWIIA